MSVGNQVVTGAVLGNPLRRSRRALRLHPLEGEQVVQILGGPLSRLRSPGTLQAAGDRVRAIALAALVLPAETLLLDARGGGLGADALGWVGFSVRLAKGVSARDESDRLFVVHGHAAERLADVLRGGEGVGIAVRSLWVHVDEAHLNRGQRVVELSVALVSLVGEELLLRPPVNEVGFPVIRAAARETEGLEAHRLQGDVAGKNHQVGPGQAAPVLLLDRPKQPPGLVEVGVIRPAVQRLEALLPAPGSTTPVGHAVGAGAVPGHANEERPIVPPVGRPPVLRGLHQLLDIGLHYLDIELLELFSVVELAFHGAGSGRVLSKRRQIEPFGPPELVRHRLPVRRSF